MTFNGVKACVAVRAELLLQRPWQASTRNFLSLGSIIYQTTRLLKISSLRRLLQCHCQIQPQAPRLGRLFWSTNSHHEMIMQRLLQTTRKSAALECNTAIRIVYPSNQDSPPNRIPTNSPFRLRSSDSFSLIVIAPHTPDSISHPHGHVFFPRHPHHRDVIVVRLLLFHLLEKPDTKTDNRKHRDASYHSASDDGLVQADIRSI